MRYEQTQDTSHISHSHDGLNGVRLQYDVDLHSHPRTLDNAREAKVRIMGKQGTIDYLEHGCGLTPIVKCYVGGKEVKIRVNIDRTTGFVAWSSEQEFTRADEAYLVIYGLANEYVIDDDAPEIDLTEYWCGYEWNVNDSDPSVKRITGKGLEDFFLREGGGILKGKLFKYVAVNPSTKEEVEVPIDDAEAYENYRYGQHGDLFAKMRGQLYYKVEKEGDIRRKKLSRYQLPGFKPYHSNDYIVYIGLYEASCNNERTKIYSRVTPVDEYSTHIGGDKNSNYTTKLHNMPATNISTPTFSNIAHSKGEGYDIMDYMTWLMLSDLFMAEFGTRNSQATIQSTDSNGYSRGGLGNGCTNVSNWEAYNNYNPVAELGCTDSLGSGYGQRLIPACSNGVEPANAVYANRFYGIENPFGHIVKLVTGLHVITKAGVGQTYESRNMYICDNPEKFMIDQNRDLATDDITTQFEAGYDFEGDAPIGLGYVKYVVMGTYGSMLASANGASTSSYFCDYNYTNYGEPQFTSSLRWATFGGAAYSGLTAGFFSFATVSGWSSVSSDYGTRLCLYKQPYNEMPFFVEDASGEENEVVVTYDSYMDSISNTRTYQFEYSYDEITWHYFSFTTKQTVQQSKNLSLRPYQRIYFRGNNSYTGFIRWNCEKYYKVGGNPLSIQITERYWDNDYYNSKPLERYSDFNNWFSNSNNLIDASDLILPSFNANVYMYQSTFTNTSLNKAPIIRSRYLNGTAYNFIYCFKGCKNLNWIKTYLMVYNNTNNAFTKWLDGVSPTGTFLLPEGSTFADDAPRSGDGIPPGWTIKYFDPETDAIVREIPPIE